jgi:hypothetical protein
MNPLPICIFTKDRTKLACFVIDQLKKNLSAEGYEPALILCDDGSPSKHMNALTNHAGDWLYQTTNVMGRGLGASMNAGLQTAFQLSDVVLRMEDDWVLQKPLEIGPWIDLMKNDSIGAIRMGMMFRDPDELKPYGDPKYGLLRLHSRKNRVYNINNQVALVHEQMYDLVGPYKEHGPAQTCERDFATRFNAETSGGDCSPWICWPKGWATKTYDDPSLAFIHAGKSTLGHHQYTVPERYKKYNQ